MKEKEIQEQEIEILDDFEELEKETVSPVPEEVTMELEVPLENAIPDANFKDLFGVELPQEPVEEKTLPPVEETKEAIGEEVIAGKLEEVMTEEPVPPLVNPIMESPVLTPTGLEETVSIEMELPKKEKKAKKQIKEKKQVTEEDRRNRIGVIFIAALFVLLAVFILLLPKIFDLMNR